VQALYTYANLDLPTWPVFSVVRGTMQRLDLDYWYTLGRAMALLEHTFGVTPCDVDARGWSRANTALGWLKGIATGDFVIIPATRRLALELVNVLEPLIKGAQGQFSRVDENTQAKIFSTITAFHNIVRSGAQEIYVFHLHGRGAYSVSALLEDASVHLSVLAQRTIPESEKKDFGLAGACYACDLWTATGFHAMRALEAEARRYHRMVTSAAQEVDWTLDALINGNSGRNQFGLRDQWKKEGASNDNPLLLIITLLTSLNHIYRNPIMHPEMTLDSEKAKQVFDTAALAISTMVENSVTRQNALPK
jgi:hypothetical protein